MQNGYKWDDRNVDVFFIFFVVPFYIIVFNKKYNFKHLELALILKTNFKIATKLMRK